MAVVTIQVKPVSRADGRSATAAAAYRSGDLIVCEREGKKHDYSKKMGIDKQHSKIILPTGITSKIAQDRGSLWNTAEAAEKRKDARVAREYIIALPKECTDDERRKLAYDFAQTIADRFGVAADVNLHAPHQNKDGTDNQNYHAHILTTTRKIGLDGLGEKSEIELSDTKRKQMGLGSAADEIYSLRETWTAQQNVMLEQYGIKLTAASLKNQGSDLEPTYHMGAELTALERQGINTALGNMNREIIARNQERTQTQAHIAELENEIIASEKIINALQTEKAKQPPPMTAEEAKQLMLAKAQQVLNRQATPSAGGTGQDNQKHMKSKDNDRGR